MLTYHFISPSNPCQPRVRMATGCHADNLPSRYPLQRDKRTNVVFLFILPKYFANYLCLDKPYLAFSCSENRQMSAPFGAYSDAEFILQKLKNGCVILK